MGVAQREPTDVREPAARSQVERSVLVVNSKSRTGREAYAQARAKLSELGVALEAEWNITRAKHLREVIRESLLAGARRIIVGGGDGTVSCAADILSHTNAVLGVIPLGTGNDFARGLGIPLDVAGACEVIARGRLARVDMGSVNGRSFLNAASIGLTTAVARRASPTMKKRMGKLAYAVLATTEAMDIAPFRVRMRTPERTLSVDALQVVIGNGRYHGGGRSIAPAAAVNDGHLDAYVIVANGPKEGARWKNLKTLAGIARRLRKGEHVDHDNVIHLRSTQLYLSADPPQQLNVDGELFDDTPARFEVRPGALRVLVPAGGGL